MGKLRDMVKRKIKEHEKKDFLRTEEMIKTFAQLSNSLRQTYAYVQESNDKALSSALGSDIHQICDRFFAKGMSRGAIADVLLQAAEKAIEVDNQEKERKI